MMSTATISFLNVCSVVRKTREVKDLLSTRGIHVLGLAETWLKPSVSDGEVAIPNYTMHRKDRVG